MTGNQLYAALETGVWALLVTVLMVVAYVVVRRMATQMHKGVVKASPAVLEELLIRRMEDGQLLIELAIPPHWKGTIAMAYELEDGMKMEAFYTSIDPVESIEYTQLIPEGARALIIDVPGQKLYRALP